jgi:hypothetical protein
MSSSTTTLQVTGLGRQKAAALARKAKSMGMTPQEYLKYLVEQDLEMDRRVSETSLAEILGRGREIDEQELDRVVEIARNRYHARTARKGK